MGFELVEYNKLKGKLLGSIRTFAKYYKQNNVQNLINSYANDTVKSESLGVLYSKIPQPRRTQIGILLTIIRCLDASAETQMQDSRLNAIGCYLYELIDDVYNPEESYLNYFASFVTSPDNSKFHYLLGNSLDFRANNIPDTKDKFQMYSTLRGFIRECVYLDPENPTLGYLPFNSFSSEKIEQFDVEDFLQKLNDRIAELDNALIFEAKTVNKSKLVNPATTGLGLFPVAENVGMPIPSHPQAEVESSYTYELQGLTP